MSDHELESETPTDAALLEVAERFAIVPEWLLDADISDTAIRLYAVLLRYGQSSGARMPGRATLARRLRKKSVDTIDRAIRELVTVGAVSVEHRFADGQRLTNRYHLHACHPAGPKGEAQPPTSPEHHDEPAGSRKNAATPDQAGHAERGNECGGSRKNAARVAAPLRHNPKHLTQTITTSTPQPPTATEEPNRWRAEEDRFLTSLGITDAEVFLADIVKLRRDAGGTSARWARPSLVAALQAAVKARGWPAEDAATALKIVAADPATRSPMRLAEAGPWWDDAAAASAHAATAPPAGEKYADDADDGVPLTQVEAELAEADGLRVRLQAEARHQLRAEGIPLTRATVLRRAHQLLQERGTRGVTAC